jgi:hypothetical protein
MRGGLNRGLRSRRRTRLLAADPAGSGPNIVPAIQNAASRVIDVRS